MRFIAAIVVPLFSLPKTSHTTVIVIFAVLLYVFYVFVTFSFIVVSTIKSYILSRNAFLSVNSSGITGSDTVIVMQGGRF